MSLDAALHEAAHCAVAVELGATVRSVEVHDDGGGLTRLDRADLPRFTLATIAAAGYEAGRLRLERSAGGGYVQELDGAASDLERLRAEIPGDGDTARDLRRQAMDKSHSIVRRRWAEVQLLAAVLDERRHLGGREVAVLLGIAPPAPQRRPAAPPARSGATRRTASPTPARTTATTRMGPWLIAVRAYEVRGHQVIPGTRALPNSPAVRADPAAWRPMRNSDSPAIETRGGGTVAVR